MQACLITVACMRDVVIGWGR